MPMRMVRAALVDALIYGRLVGRLRDRFALFASDIYPQISGNLHFSKGVFGRGAELGAKWEIGSIGNVCCVLFAVEDVDVVVLHSRSSRVSLAVSTRDVLPCRSAFARPWSRAHP